MVAKARPAIDALVWQRGGRAAPQACGQAQQAQADPEGEQYSCPRCERAFPTQKALTMHMVTTHEHTSAVAAHVDVEWCPCRAKYFHAVRRRI
eukprot:8193508-Alexandrium_andersonii.AAC.1